MVQQHSSAEKTMLISYMTLRKIVGCLGILLPVVLLLLCCIYCKECQQDTISAYFHTSMRDVFVGILCAIGVFLFSYKGYDNYDGIAGNIAGLSAIGIAMFPTDLPNLGLSFSGVMHYVCAVCFFITLIYFSYFLFTKTKEGEEPTPMKLIRNKIYKTCGIIMFLSLVFFAIYSFWKSTIFSQFNIYAPGFWFEAIALWAFGVSWLVKGEIVLQDEKSSQSNQYLSSVALVVSDYDEAIKFYTQKLKFFIKEDTVISPTKRWVVISPPGKGSCDILLAKAADEIQHAFVGNQTGGRVFLFLMTDNFDRDYNSLVHEGVEIFRTPTIEAYGKVAVFLDLYGNKWDLIQPKNKTSTYADQ